MMGEMLEFPANENRLLYLGKKSSEQGDDLKAIQYFNDSYETSQSLEVNYLLVKALINVGRLETAYIYMKEYEDDYREQSELQPLYFDILLKRKQFLVLEKWLLTFDRAPHLSEEFKQTLNQTQKYWTLVDKTDYTNRLLRIKSIEKVSFIKQKALLQEMNYLTKLDFFKLSSEIFLISKNISPLIRSQIIDELVQLKYEGTVSILDVFGQLHHHAKLNEMNRLMPSVKNNSLYKDLSEYMENNQPSQETLVLNIVKTHLGMMYPYIDDIVTDVKSWNKAYLTYFGFDIIDNQEVNKINQQIQLLDRIMMNTMTK